MREKSFLSKSLLDREDLLQEIKSLGEEYGYRIIEERTYNNNDIDFYRDVSDDEFYLISFWLTKEEHFFVDECVLHGHKYYLSLTIVHDSEMLSEVNILIRDILEKYPELLVTAEGWKHFYSKEDIESGNVAAWLKE